MGPIPACLLLFVLLGIEPNLLELHNTDQVLCQLSYGPAPVTPSNSARSMQASGCSVLGSCEEGHSGVGSRHCLGVPEGTRSRLLAPGGSTEGLVLAAQFLTRQSSPCLRHFFIPGTAQSHRSVCVCWLGAKRS